MGWPRSFRKTLGYGALAAATVAHLAAWGIEQLIYQFNPDREYRK